MHLDPFCLNRYLIAAVFQEFGISPESQHMLNSRCMISIEGSKADFIKSIESGEINFDRLIATPDMMPQLAKIGQILGPKGLMPNPKLGTVTNDVSKAIKDAKKGQVQFKNDKSGIIHAGVGKLSFDKEKLRDNIKTFFEAILKNKPEGIKGSYVKRVSIASTMGIGIKLNVADLQKN